MKNRKISDRDALRQYLSEIVGNVDVEPYEISYEELLERVVENCIDHLREKHGFQYGQDMPEIEEKTFWSFFEIEEN
jgi:hypothetical protein